jgi:hypothetical protein
MDAEDSYPEGKAVGPWRRPLNPSSAGIKNKYSNKSPLRPVPTMYAQG